MSLTQFLSTTPFSLTGIQNANTINGNTPCDSITILNQTQFLSASVVNQQTGNINLDLHIPNASATTTGILTSTDWNTFNTNSNILSSNNIFTGTNQFNNNILITTPIIQFTNLGTTAESHFIAFNPSTGLITYNPTSSLSILGSNNTFAGTNYFANADIRFSGIGTTSQTHFLAINTSTGLITSNPISGLSILGQNNTFTGTNCFTNVDIRFSGLTTSSDTSFLRYNTSTGQISSSLISSLLLPTINVFTQTNTFSSFLYLNTANTFGMYMPSSNVMRIGFNNGLSSPPTTNSFMDFNNAGSSALYGNGSFTLEVAKTVLGSSSDMYLNDRTLYLRGTSNSNNYFGYASSKDGWKLAGNIGGEYGSTFTGSYIKMFEYDGSNNIHYENNGDTMAYLVRNNITDLKWVVFRTPTSYAFYNTLSNTLGTVSDERTKQDIKAIDTNKSKEFILSITPSTFRFIDGNTEVKNIGFIAQDLLKNAKTEAQKNIVSNWKIYEEALAKGEEAYEDYQHGDGTMKKRKVMLGVSAMSIIPELVGAYQAMEKENNILKERLNRLEQLLNIS